MRRALITVTAALAAGPVAAQTARSQAGDAMAVARPGEVIVGGSNANQTLTCNGGSAFIGGERNRTNITGACERVVVGGSNNEVRVRLAPGARVHVGGSNNRVAWTLANGGAAPEVINGGDGNVVERGGR